MWKQIFNWNEFIQLAAEDNVGNVITLLTFLAIILTHVLIKTPKGTKLGFSYWWYLTNAYFFHWYMEVLGGLFGYVKSTYYLYYMMDTRYFYKDPIVHFICQLEIYVMGPMCLIVSILFKTDKKFLRVFLSLIISVIQLTGTILYFFQPIMNGFNDFYCSPTCFTFTPDNLFFYWFGCWMTNPWWVIVPIKQILKAYRELQEMVENKQVEKKKVK